MGKAIDNNFGDVLHSSKLDVLDVLASESRFQELIEIMELNTPIFMFHVLYILHKNRAFTKNTSFSFKETCTDPADCAKREMPLSAREENRELQKSKRNFVESKN